MPVCLEPFEDLLGVVEHGRGGVERERAVGMERAVVPSAVRRPGRRDHVVGEVLSEAGAGEDRLPAFGRHRRLRRLATEVEACGHGCTVPNRELSEEWTKQKVWRAFGRANRSKTLKTPPAVRGRRQPPVDLGGSGVRRLAGYSVGDRVADLASGADTGVAGGAGADVVGNRVLDPARGGWFADVLEE